MVFIHGLNFLWKERLNLQSKINGEIFHLRKFCIFKQTTKNTLDIFMSHSAKYFIHTLCEKCPNTEVFLVRFSCIRTEYGDILGKPQYSAQIQENADQKNLRICTLFMQWQSWKVLKTRCKVTGQLRKALEETWVLQGEKELPLWTKFNGAQIRKLY